MSKTVIHALKLIKIHKKDCNRTSCICGFFQSGFNLTRSRLLLASPVSGSCAKKGFPSGFEHALTLRYLSAPKNPCTSSLLFKIGEASHNKYCLVPPISTDTSSAISVFFDTIFCQALTKALRSELLNNPANDRVKYPPQTFVISHQRLFTNTSLFCSST